jgi:hypothetical protein
LELVHGADAHPARHSTIRRQTLPFRLLLHRKQLARVRHEDGHRHVVAVHPPQVPRGGDDERGLLRVVLALDARVLALLPLVRAAVVHEVQTKGRAIAVDLQPLHNRPVVRLRVVRDHHTAVAAALGARVVWMNDSGHLGRHAALHRQRLERGTCARQAFHHRDGQVLLELQPVCLDGRCELLVIADHNDVLH